VTADELALLRGVEAAPDDDLPRLVYADWLDEHGRHARADFIRVQCELASIERRLPGMTAEEKREAEVLRDELAKTEREMMSTRRDESVGVAPTIEGTMNCALSLSLQEHYERGFLKTFSIYRFFENHTADILSCSKMIPRPRIEITSARSLLDSTRSHPDLLRREVWSEVDVVEMYNHGPSQPLLPHEFIPLMRLDFRRLASFNSDRMELNPGHVCVIAERLRAPNLWHINLADNQIVDSGVAFLHRAIYAKTLRSIDLSRNPICRPEISKLTKDRFPSLVRLDLTECPIMPQSLAQLRKQLPGVEVIC